jgi:hypothetical protein
MRCPQCGFENLVGSDICDNCGADLAGRDTPESATTYRGPLLGEHLDELEVGEPEIVDISADAAEAVRRMHDHGTDCVLVVDGGRLVGNGGALGRPRRVDGELCFELAVSRAERLDGQDTAGELRPAQIAAELADVRADVEDAVDTVLLQREHESIAEPVPDDVEPAAIDQPADPVRDADSRARHDAMLPTLRRSRPAARKGPSCAAGRRPCRRS